MQFRINSTFFPFILNIIKYSTETLIIGTQLFKYKNQTNSNLKTLYNIVCDDNFS